ncbi:antitoxin Xre/MbcA/ParS toxin-binding domain-containing protein [Marinobacter subterrani]|uniref:antitoxin Xre/MbcA/ParS toxin-binding domain-containing protein n=1 Tax=Marinobacter subterrani TaxID=1658765 RepID=UPI003B5A3A40
MTERKSYSLGDLVAQCDPDAAIPDTLREWERMMPVGLELVITPHAVDVVHQAIRTWESRNQALEWLQRPVSALEGERPCDLLGTVDGCCRIASVLHKIEHGDFS